MLQVTIRDDRTPIGDHPGRYNMPSQNNPEIAVLFPDDPCHPRDIVLKQQGGQLQRINELNANYDPLQYVLMFPDGTQGYSWEKYKSSPVTLMKYYKHRLMLRKVAVDYHTAQGTIQSSQGINPVLCFNQLTNQFIVDMACKIITTRLRWFRLHQKELRAESYGTLITALQSGSDGSSVGRRFVLPATYRGSPRYMYEKHQDTMAIVRRFDFHYFYVFLLYSILRNGIVIFMFC